MVAIKDFGLHSCCESCEMCRDGYCVITENFCTDRENKVADDCPLVEIGTCKDCENFHNVRKDFNICSLWTIACADNHYCADFEKRGNENEIN